MNPKLFLTVFALVVVFSSYSQTPAASKKALQDFQQKADSIGHVINARQTAKADSLYQAKYVQALERSNELQNGNNTYYSVPIAIITGIVTLFAVAIGINVISVASYYRKKLKEQREESSAELKREAELFKTVMSNQETTFNALVEQIKKVNADWTAEAQNKLKNFEERLKAVKDGGDTVNTLKKEFDEFKDIVKQRSNKEEEEKPIKFIDYLRMNQSTPSHSKLYEMIMADSQLTCPHCHQTFMKMLATRVKDIPLTYKCPNLLCGKEVEARGNSPK